MPKATKVPAYQLKISLLDVEPAVWRRVVLPGHWNLSLVHSAVQVAMGWEDSHLHQFEAGDVRYAPPNPYGGGGEVRREGTARLHEVVSQVGDTLSYWYDFGDDWYHDLVVEQVLPPQPYAQCLDGAHACPPEDCGGPWGYLELLAALGDPQHPEHDELLDWVGNGFDPAAFDVDQADKVLRSM